MIGSAFFAWPSPLSRGDRVAMVGSSVVQVVVESDETFARVRAQHDASEELIIPPAWLRPVLAS